MAFIDVRNLKQKIEEYLTGQNSWASDASSRRMLIIAYYHVLSCQESSRRVFGKKGNPVEIICKAVRRLKEALESYVLERIDLEKEIHIFAQTVHNKLEKEFAAQLYNSLLGGGEEDEVVENTEMVGFSNQYKHLKKMLTEHRLFSLVGMPGIGKTTLAKELFKDSKLIFDCHVWVRVGRNCGFKEMLRRILVEMSVEEDGDVVGSLNRSLKGKRYLIVLDDVWDRYCTLCLLDGVYSHRGNKSQLRYPFPNDNNGSQLLVISRLQQKYTPLTMEMELMNREESWRLLSEKVFGQERCPSQLETFGRKIADKCEGHPLTIITVAKLLSRENKTVEYWNEVATRKRHQLFRAAHDEMYKVLLPSFNYLPPCLQKCFMYIGMFPQDYEIPRSKLINLWTVDGFLGIDQEKYPLEVAVECLEELVSNSMVMIKKTLNSRWQVGEKRIKTCKLHSSLRNLSNREGRSSKFSHILDSLDDGFGEDIKAQHRLSFHNNVLFAIKDVNKSVVDNCASIAHSLFCYGSYLQYQVPICFGLRLLKKLDALAIRLYEFPVEVLQLVELRYLALTLNGHLPATIFQLSKLQFLIVHPHQRIKSCKEPSYLPMEIWNMQELQHLQITGKDLLNPCGASLKNLSTLASVSPNSCTVEVLEALPNLKKLGIEIELRHDDDSEKLRSLALVGRITRIAWLKCVALNPTLSYSFSSLSFFPIFLRKLTLNGLGYAWEEIDKIGSLEYLQMLKLRNYAFRGPVWEVKKQLFPQLQSLVIEDTDLETWRIGHRNLVMKNLVIKCSYKLKEIHGKFGHHLYQIEIVDSNPIGAKQLKTAANFYTTVNIRRTWCDEKPKP